MLSEIKILMIDDDDEDFIIVKDLWDEISRHKNRIDWASSYKDGLKLIAEKKHDAYLIDYRLGADDGLELIREAIKNGCNAPLILLTGQNDIEIDKEAMKAGASDYLVKGAISASQLERSIRYSIRQAKNIQEIKQLNTDLERKLEDIKFSEEKYRNLFRNSVVSMHITDMKTFKALDVNDTAIHLFGYQSKKDFLDNYDSLAHFVNAEERLKIIKILNEKGEARIGMQEMKRVDGTHFWANMFVKLNSKKNIAQTVIIDITQQIRSQEELENQVKERTLELTESLIREKESNEIKSRFVSMASHEFRTPLSAILSSISLLEKYTDPEHADKREKHFERIKSSIKNLTEILGDFLSLDKLEHGKIDILIEPFDLHKLSDNIKESVEGMLKEKQIVINHIHKGNSNAVSDGKIIRHILSNLLSNAIKYSHQNSEIGLTTEVNENHIVINVKDNGIGIPGEDQKNLFNMFHRAKNVDNIQGTGLGLNIVKRYVEVLEGTIMFNSKINEGTTFRIEIPQN